MTMLIAVPLAAMCVFLFGALLCFVVVGFNMTKNKPVAMLFSWIFWGFFGCAAISAGFAAVVKLALVFSEST